MMILSPAIVLKDRPAPQNHKLGREVLMGALLVCAGLGVVIFAKAHRDTWE